MKSWCASVSCAVVAALLSGACARAPKPQTRPTSPAAALGALLPLPKTLDARSGPPFTITADTVIVVPSGSDAAAPMAEELGTLVKRASGLTLRVTNAPASEGTPSFAFTIGGAPLGDEGYELTIDAKTVSLRASTPAGVFYALQTVRQLLPSRAEYAAVLYQNPMSVALPALHITDAPRFAWRGAMLDVARHFFGVADVKRLIDLLALHKMNRLHLHLADDQGWRIEIKSRPNLTQVGASTAVGGAPGGSYTQAQYADLVAYAAARFITIVPEIDMPGHTNAALASYPELNCNGTAPAPYTGTDVGFSVFCIDRDTTYRFIDEIVEEIASLSPGPYFHAGGDEVKTLTPDQYRTFVEHVQQIVSAHGKQMIGWDEIAATTLLPTSIVQHWRPDAAAEQLSRAPHLILSPSNRAYVDMKYNADTPIGLSWAGLISVRQAYDWDPDRLVPGVRAGAILGIEAPLWSETITKMSDVEYLEFPRLAAIADVAWAPARAHDWRAFRARLGQQAPRWIALGVNFYRAPEIDWRVK